MILVLLSGPKFQRSDSPGTRPSRRMLIPLKCRRSSCACAFVCACARYACACAFKTPTRDAPKRSWKPQTYSMNESYKRSKTGRCRVCPPTNPDGSRNNTREKSHYCSKCEHFYHPTVPVFIYIIIVTRLFSGGDLVVLYCEQTPPS